MRKLIDRFKKWRGDRSVMAFDSALYAEQAKATNLYNAKGPTVVCAYCGKLLPKEEDAYEYNIVDRVGRFSHEECFRIQYPLRDLKDLIERS